jgi:23S rRNA (guanosine2251-2'-O)-methyltransferase
VHRVYLAEGVQPGFEETVMAAAAGRGVEVQRVARVWLDQRGGGQPHQGVMAEAAPVDFVDLDEVLGRMPAGRDPFLMALDQVQDPHNLGAIIRTAAAAGADAVIVPERRSAGLGLGTLKAAAGTAEWFPVVRVVNLARTIDQLKERGIWAVGADGAARQAAWQADLRRPLLLVVGGEDRGLGRLVRDKCDYLVMLPMQPGVQSLNTSVAAAVLLYEARRQRDSAVSPPAGAP